MDISFLNLNFWILQSVAMGITALLIPKLKITSLFGATLMVVGLALVNAHLWDAALFFSVPDSLTTHAATLFIANGAIFWLLVKLLPGIEVSGVLAALIAPTVFSVSSLILSKYATQIDFIDLAKKAIVQIEETRAYLKNESPKVEATPEKGEDSTH